MQSSQRLYPGLNTITSTATMTRYSPTGTGATTAAAAYRTRMPSVGIHKLIIILLSLQLFSLPIIIFS
uniref:Bm8515 n=1 Tax=Brugia malayi TaxID=6279 RepID=A0A1U7F3F6_BRUMA|nr:Bm8515 [Brugia malayi]